MRKNLYILTPKNQKFVRFTVTSNLSSLLKGNEKYKKKSIDEEFKRFGGLDLENSFFVSTQDPGKLKSRLKVLFGSRKVQIEGNLTGKSDMICGRSLEELKEVIATREFMSLHDMLHENKEGDSKIKIIPVDFDKYKPEEKKINKNIEFKTTPEQQKIIDFVKGNPECNVKINAFAGTGKTSTLQLVAQNVEEKILYLAFNNSIASEGKKKFPKNVSVMTTHSMALYAIKNYTKLDGSNLKNNEYKVKEIKEYFENKTYDTLKSALSLLETFCNSNETFEGFFSDDEDYEELSIAKSLWNKMDEGDISFTHDYYLKKFDLLLQEGKIDITKYDTIMLDEAQDTNEVTFSIFKNIQAKRKIIVGDKHQQIYSFRGSINLMTQFEGEEFFLTQTFRYNKDIALKASFLLQNYKWEENTITSSVEPCEDYTNEAYLFRTNSAQIKCIASFLQSGKYFKTIRHPKSIFSQIIELAYFKRGEKDKIRDNKYLTFFESIYEIIEYADNINDISLKTAIKILQEEGYTLEDLQKMLDKTIEYYEKNIPAPIYISTIHTSKGLEWDKVTLGEDLVDIVTTMEKEDKNGGISKEEWSEGEDNLKYSISKEKKNMIIEEINLLYVAITRAKNVLNIDLTNKKLWK